MARTWSGLGLGWGLGWLGLGSGLGLGLRLRLGLADGAHRCRVLLWLYPQLASKHLERTCGTTTRLTAAAAERRAA